MKLSYMYHTCKYRSFFIESKSTKSHFLHTLIQNFNCSLFFKIFVLSNSFVNLATVFVKLTTRSISLLCSSIKGCEYCECLYFYNYYPYRIVSKITLSSPCVSIRIISCDDRIVSSLVIRHLLPVKFNLTAFWLSSHIQVIE